MVLTVWNEKREVLEREKMKERAVVGSGETEAVREDCI